MAYTPDEAFSDINEVGQKAFLLFAFYCKHGSMTNNRVAVSLESAAKFLGIVYENACRLNAVLKKKGWIQIEKGETVLLKGYKLTKTTVSETDENNSLVIAKVEQTDENVSLQDEELTKTTVLVFPAKLKTDENNSPKLTKTTVAYKEEPALLNQQENTEEKDKSFDLSKKKRKTPIPEDFAITADMRTWSAEKVPRLDVDYETSNFVDHYRNKGETGLDWIAKWRTWMRNAFTDFGKFPKGKPSLNGGNNGNSIKTSGNQPGPDRTAGKSNIEEVRSRIRARKPTDVRL